MCIRDRHKDVLTIKAEVIECRDKPSFPVGELGVNAFGEVGHYEDRDVYKRQMPISRDCLTLSGSTAT